MKRLHHTAHFGALTALPIYIGLRLYHPINDGLADLLVGFGFGAVVALGLAFTRLGDDPKRTPDG